MNPSVIVAGARTPIGRLIGGLSSVSCTELGGVAIRKAIARAGVRGDQVDYVIVGQVLQAGTGQMTARQAAHAGGVQLRVPAVTINKVCLSGINAIAIADKLIRAGIHEIVLAGGMDSMNRTPHLLPSSRRGQKYGDVAPRAEQAPRAGEFSGSRTASSSPWQSCWGTSAGGKSGHGWARRRRTGRPTASQWARSPGSGRRPRRLATRGRRRDGQL